ncbi:MAG TPA: methyl-accepting chemotaxis protein [Abditibacterium sp.]|jgi:methyl-accepting chemotaxis protein
MKISKTMRVKTKLAALVALFTAAFCTFWAVSHFTIESVKVGGPGYSEIVLGKDLIADVLPPPAYIIESILIARRIADPGKRAELSSLIAKSRSLENDFKLRHEFWQQNLPAQDTKDQRLRELMLKEAYDPAIRFFSTVQNRLIPTVESGNYKAASQIVLGPIYNDYNLHRVAIDEVVKATNIRNARVENEVASTVRNRAVTMLLLGLGILALSTIGIGIYLNRSIAGALQETATALSSTSSEIAATIEEHERTAMHQSAAVHETTATMDELDASFNQTAEMVTVAAETAREAAHVAESGIQTVHQTRDGMLSLREKVAAIAEQIGSLSEQTSQIGVITGLVSDLANQTNMLALNAAVEAARAGEHGRGFTVVASEIRKLADQSKKSAERINALVEDIQKATNSTVMATEEGTKTVDKSILTAQETVRAFDMVANSANSASDAAQQTLLSVPQQVTAVRQVLTAMDALNTGARETADGIGQTKIGVENLRQTALKLKEMI